MCSEARGCEPAIGIIQSYVWTRSEVFQSMWPFPNRRLTPCSIPLEYMSGALFFPVLHCLFSFIFPSIPLYFLFYFHYSFRLSFSFPLFHSAFSYSFHRSFNFFFLLLSSFVLPFSSLFVLPFSSPFVFLFLPLLSFLFLPPFSFLFLPPLSFLFPLCPSYSFPLCRSFLWLVLTLWKRMIQVENLLKNFSL